MNDAADPLAAAVGKARLVAQVLASSVALFGLLAAVGWALDTTAVDAALPGKRIRLIPAVGFLGAGLGLVCTIGRNPALRRAGLAIFVLLELVAATYLIAQVLGLGVTRSHAGLAAAGSTASMSPGAAIGFTMTATAGILLYVGHRRTALLAQLVAVVLVMLSLNALFGYAYREEGLYRTFDAGGLAYASAVAFGFLGIASIYADCRFGLGSVLVDSSLSGRLTRRLVPSVFLSPLVLGTLAIEGLQRGWFGNGVAVSLITTGSTIVIVIALYLSIRSLRSAETERAVAMGMLGASESMYRNSFENAFIGIAHLDADGQFLRVNEQLARLLGYTTDELDGSNAYEFVHPDDVEDLRDHLQSLRNLANRTVHGRVRCLGKNGERVCDMRATAHANHSGSFSHFSFIVLDITAQDRLTLEREQLLATALQERNRAREAAKARDALLAIVSHELRSPLNSIRLWTSLMQDGDGDRRNDTRSLHQIETAVTALSRLIDDLLDVSRIESGRLELERGPVSISSLVEETVAQLQPAAKGKDLKLRSHVATEESVIVRGDRHRLGQVVRNLLDNAIKFTPAQGAIDVTVDASSGGVELTVTDTGEGLEAAQLPHIFARFRQVDARATRRHGGLGLGLHIVHHIVTAHGGNITVSSDGLGTGTTFRVTLPRAEDDARGEAAPAALSDRAGVEGDILVVDDEADTCEALALALGMRGYAVRTATSTKQALAKITERRPTVLVSDLMMPERTGYDLIADVREREYRADLPRIRAIAISGAGGPADRRNARRSGFDGYLAKPVQVRQLVDWLQSATPADSGTHSILLTGRTETLEGRLRSDGHVVVVATQRTEAVQVANQQRSSFAIVDVDDEEGPRIARQLRSERPSLLVIGITSGAAEKDDALDCLLDQATAWQDLRRLLHGAGME